MLACAHCGSKNSEGLKFCQDCGQKLAPPLAESRPAEARPDGAAPLGSTMAGTAAVIDRRDIPDTSVRASAPSLGPVVPCPRCRCDNRPGMNFCKMCGATLPQAASTSSATEEGGGTRQAVAAPRAVPGAIGRGAMVVEQQVVMGPICPRCRGANAAGAEFCRFCGTPLAASPEKRSDKGPVVAAVPAPAPPMPAPTPPAKPSYATVLAPGSPPPPAVAARPPVEARADAAPSAPLVRTVPSSATPMPMAGAAEAIAGPTTDSMPTVIAPAFDEETADEADGVTTEVAMPGRAVGRRATGSLGAVVAPASAQLTTLLRDGTEGRKYPLSGEQTDLGRQEGNILLPDDPYICPRHARIVRRDGKFFLRDLESVNGLFVRIASPVDLQHGDVILVGQQVLVFELLPDAELGFGPATQHGTLVFGTPEGPRLARLCQMTTEGVPRDLYHLSRAETIIGREVGDIVFTDDGFLSRRHAAVKLDTATRRFRLLDFESSNGTYVRFRGERELCYGDRFRVGQHLFRFEPMSHTETGQ